MNDVRHISVYTNRSPSDVYKFASNPENLPRLPAGLSTGMSEKQFAEDKKAVEKDLRTLKAFLEYSS
ncbi:MAG: hypothetical protein ABJM11_14265 [Marinobacter sp.]|uniref:hypothetical protein n=1 Tax=Marinobacter sp. TaxID=50741 RepID=UPI0032997FB0